MIDTTAALYAWLTGHAPITAAIDTYSGFPAVFEQYVPDDHEIGGPVVVLDAPSRNDRENMNACRAREVVVNIRVYANVRSKDGDTGSAALHVAAETIANELHNFVLPLNGGVTMGALVSGPVLAPTESPSIGGRLITLRWRIKET